MSAVCSVINILSCAAHFKRFGAGLLIFNSKRHVVYVDLHLRA